METIVFFWFSCRVLMPRATFGGTTFREFARSGAKGGKALECAHRLGGRHLSLPPFVAGHLVQRIGHADHQDGEPNQRELNIQPVAVH